MPSSHLIPCRPLLLLPPIPPSLRVFSNESALPMRRPKYNPSPNLVGLTRCLMCTRCLPPHHRCFSMLPVCLTALVPLQVYSTTVSFPFCPFASSLCSLPLCRCGHVLPLTETDQEGPAAFHILKQTTSQAPCFPAPLYPHLHCTLDFSPSPD